MQNNLIVSWQRHWQWLWPCLALIAALRPIPAMAADWPTPHEADWQVPTFQFHSGETLPNLRLHYTTLGDPSQPAVLVLHGTLGSGKGLLTPAFAGELFGPGQPLDAARHFIILPDGIGSGGSAKPSDGLRMAFPHYNYDDCVEAQYRLVHEHLGIAHLRVVLGYSMGGMQAWLWAEQHPAFMDLVVPMAATPTEMSGRNWMLRRLVIDSIRNDPAWQGGNYTSQPPSLQFASVFFGLATVGGNLELFQQASTRAAADALLDGRLHAAFTGDANDHLYQWEASRDFNPTPALAQIRAPVLAINSADDPRNPPELGVMERVLPKLPHAELLLIPIGPNTRGHGTTLVAAFWRDRLAARLADIPAGNSH